MQNKTRSFEIIEAESKFVVIDILDLANVHTILIWISLVFFSPLIRKIFVVAKVK